MGLCMFMNGRTETVVALSPEVVIALRAEAMDDVGMMNVTDKFIDASVNNVVIPTVSVEKFARLVSKYKVPTPPPYLYLFVSIFNLTQCQF